MATLKSEDVAWAQIKYEQKITTTCYAEMLLKMDEVNDNRSTKTVTLYHILHGDKQDKPLKLLYAPQIPRNFAAANRYAKHPDWYYSLVQPGLYDSIAYPDSTIKPALGSAQDGPDIHRILEIRNGFVKRASAQDVEYLKLLHDLVHKVENIERQKLEELRSAATADGDDDEDYEIQEDNEIYEDDEAHEDQIRDLIENNEDAGIEEDERNTSGTFKVEAIAPLRHVLFEFMHYDWNHKKMGLYCAEHLRQQWLVVGAESAPHHAYILIQKLEEVTGLRSDSERLTVTVGSGQMIENEPFAASSVVHPLPHLVTDECCTTDYFAELWEVTAMANNYINTRRSDPADNADVHDVLLRLAKAWYQDLSLLYKKGSHLFFRDLKEQNALQIATNMKSIHSRIPNFCSLAVLPLWHNIPYLYARLKEAYGVSDETAEDLCQHLHIAYDDIIMNLDGGDEDMKDTDN
ncbi:hypothetical protein KCU65_g8980, partial [Aureobasidium melanogenum]